MTITPCTSRRQRGWNLRTTQTRKPELGRSTCPHTPIIRTSHNRRQLYLVVPFEGWLKAYHPRMTDAAGATLPGRVAHHVAFWNTARSDFLCPNKLEHIFGAGGEMNDWLALPGYGYRVRKGDRILVTSMFHNPTDASYPSAWLQVKIEYQLAGEGQARSRAFIPRGST